MGGGWGGASVTMVIFFRRRDGIIVSPALEWGGRGEGGFHGELFLGEGMG